MSRQKQDYYHVPGMRPDLDALQRNVALIKELGLISADTDVKQHSDLTLLDDAAKRLKSPSRPLRRVPLALSRHARA